MTTYKIVFQNLHGASGDPPTNYCFFNQKPIVNGVANDPNCFTNIWISKNVPYSGNVHITTTSNFYAFCGVSPQKVGTGVVISQGLGELATLGSTTAQGSTFPLVNYQGTPTFGTEGATASPSCFEIDTGTDFSGNNNFVIGLGAADDNNIVVPAAVIPADQNMATNILPIVKFYVAKANYIQGTVVDFQSVSKLAGVIDFSSGAGLGMFAAIITHNPNGSFSTVYRSQANYNSQASFDLLSRQIAALEQKFITMNVSSGAGDPFKWLATVNWASAVTATGLMTGAGLIMAYLISKGYTIDIEINWQNLTATFKFTPPPGDEFEAAAGSVPSNVNADWKAAVAADAEDPFKHTASGVSPIKKAAPSQALITAPTKAYRFPVKQFQSNGISAF